MKIVIDPFDTNSINQAIQKLIQYEKDFRIKETEFVRRLKEIGVSVASTEFAAAKYDGTKDVLIAETQLGGRAAVIAYGETVGFIEFGTGVRNREYDSSTSEFKPPAHGTYGKGHGKNSYGWWFNPSGIPPAKHTFGNEPAEAMLKARDAMVEKVIEIAREVWK